LFHDSFPSFLSDFGSVFIGEATVPFLSCQVLTQLMRHYRIFSYERKNLNQVINMYKMLKK